MKKRIFTILLMIALASASVLSIRAATGNHFVIENGVLVAYNGPGGHIVIPVGVTRINIDIMNRWGANRDQITSITIPEGVLRIDSFAFSDMRNLTQVTFPRSLERINSLAFQNVGLRDIVLPNPNTYVAVNAFAGTPWVEANFPGLTVGNFLDEFFVFAETYTWGARWGIMSRDGEIIIENNHDSIRQLPNGSFSLLARPQPERIVTVEELRDMASLGARPQIIVPGEDIIDEGALTAQRNALSAGTQTGFYIDPTGQLWAWGNNSRGQLGDGTRINRATPVPIMCNVISVSTGSTFTLAITADGKLWSWGNNTMGALGTSSIHHSTIPINIMENVIYAAAGHDHAMAILADGSLWGWGSNTSGQLRYSMTIAEAPNNVRRSPIHLMDDVVSVAAGGGPQNSHTAAITASGELWAWGSNNAGQIGNGEVRRRQAPALVMDGVTYVAIAGNRTVALRDDSTLWAWGFNVPFQGGSMPVTRHIPTQIFEDVASVGMSAGSLMAVQYNGALYSLGDEGFLRLVGSRITLQQARLAPFRIMDEVETLAVGSNHGMVKRLDGSIVTWGGASSGQLGEGTTGVRSRYHFFTIFGEHDCTLIPPYLPFTFSRLRDGGMTNDEAKAFMREDIPRMVTPAHVQEIMLETLNTLRARVGSPPVQWNDSLERAALNHSRDMALNGFFFHGGSDGSNATARARREGWVFSVGENIHMDLFYYPPYTEARAAIGAWYFSPLHRDNMLAASYTHVGVSFYVDFSFIGGDYRPRLKWTMKLGAR